MHFAILSEAIVILLQDPLFTHLPRIPLKHLYDVEASSLVRCQRMSGDILISLWRLRSYIILWPTYYFIRHACTPPLSGSPFFSYNQSLPSFQYILA